MQLWHQTSYDVRLDCFQCSPLSRLTSRQVSLAAIEPFQEKIWPLQRLWQLQLRWRPASAALHCSKSLPILRIWFRYSQTVLTLDGLGSQVLGTQSVYQPTYPAEWLSSAAGAVRCGVSFCTENWMLICNGCRKIPTMLADHVEKNSLQGKLKYSLFVGASSGAETENRWAALNMIERRSPHQVGKAIAKGINNGNIKFFDKHLSMFPVDLVYVSSARIRPIEQRVNLTDGPGILYQGSSKQEAGCCYCGSYGYYRGWRNCSGGVCGSFTWTYSDGW